MARVLGILAVLFLIVVVIVQSVVIIVLLIDGDVGGPSFLGNDAVAVVRIDDVIMDSKTFTDRMDKYKDKDNVKAIVLRMETPGGAVAASQEIAAAVERLRLDHNKIVVTSIANIGASGGYYVATYCDKIVVNPGSLVGSIGVIMNHFQMEELAKKIGIKFSSITSGEMKDAGSISRKMTPAERAYLQGVIDDAYGQFRGAVLDTRWNEIAAAADLDAASDTVLIEAALDRVADGRILTGQQALKVGLADNLGDLQDAIDLAAELAGIEGEPDVIYHNPEDPWEEFSKTFGISRLFPSKAQAPVMLPSGLWYIYQ